MDKDSIKTANYDGDGQSTCDGPVFTPPYTYIAADESWDSPSVGTVPWHSITYLIVEKETRRPITVGKNGNACLGEPVKGGSGSGAESAANDSNRWLCVDKDNYFAFQNPTSGRYLGHDGKSGVRVSANKLQGWELLTTRAHPSGGFQLLTPNGPERMMMLTVGEDRKRLARRDHGTTLWEFIRL